MAEKEKKKRKRANRLGILFRVALLIVLLACGAIAARIVYSFSDNGRFNRLMCEIRNEEPSVIDATLVKLGLLPPRPDSLGADELLLGMMKSIRPLTHDEYASLLNHSDIYVRHEAIEMLEEVGDPRAVKALIVELEAGTAFSDSRLERLVAKCGTQPFLALLDDPNPDVRIAVAEFLITTRDKKEAVLVLARNLGRMATDGEEEIVWMKQVRRGELTMDEYRARCRRFGRVFRALGSVDDPAARQALKARYERLAKAEKQRREAYKKKTMGPENTYWSLYTHLMPNPPKIAQYRVERSPEGDCSISLPANLKPQRKEKASEIQSRFGRPTRIISSATWEYTDPEGRGVKVTGEIWRYGDEIEILFADGTVVLLRTHRVDVRIFSILPDNRQR